jgi:DNA mismatch repair protein MutS
MSASCWHSARKVAICDQSEPATPGKLVKRSLTRILSPGTTLAANQLDAQRNHYLAAFTLDKRGLHTAWLDLSTGEFRVATDARVENLLPVLTALAPAELILTEGALTSWKEAPHEDTARHALQAFCATRLVHGNARVPVRRRCRQPGGDGSPGGA